MALRLLPLIAGLAAVVLAAVVAPSLLRNRSAHLVFVGLTALSPALIYYSSEVKPYSTDVAMTMVLILLLTRHEHWRHGQLALSFGGAIAVWVSLSAVFVLAGCGVVLGVRWLSRGEHRRMAAVGATWALSATATGALTLLTGGVSENLRAFWEHAFAPAPTDVGWYHDHALAFVVHAYRDRGISDVSVDPSWFDPLTYALTVLTIVGIALAARRNRELRAATAALTISGLFALGFSALDLYPFGSRLLLFLVPLPFLAAATVVDEAAEHRTLAALVGVGIVAVTIPGAVDHQTHHDSEASLRYMEAHGDEDDQLVVPFFTDAILAHYESGFVVAKRPVAVAPLDDPLAVIDILVERQPGRTWLFVAHDVRAGESIAAELRESADVLDSFEADGTAAYLFDLDADFARRARSKP